jgi:hypothetical protein
MSGMLMAIPGTPLYERLKKEGRLDESEPFAFGTNVIPGGMSQKELYDGYIRQHVMMYSPEEYFHRLDSLFLDPSFDRGFGRNPEYWRRHRIRQFLRSAENLLKSFGLFFMLMRYVPEPGLRREYRRRFIGILKARRRPGLLTDYLFHTAFHYHAWTVARRMEDGTLPVVNTY